MATGWNVRMAITNALSKIVLFLVLVALVFGCVASSQPEVQEFNKIEMLEQEIYRLFDTKKGHARILKTEREKLAFVLYPGKPLPSREEMYGNKRSSQDSSEMFVAFQCDEHFIFEIHSNGRKVGHISAGNCTSKRDDLKKLSHYQEKYFDALIKLFPESKDENAGDRRKAGWFYRKENLRNIEVHQFPVFLFGHGVAWPLTTIAFSNRNRETYLVQIDLTPLCFSELEPCMTFSQIATEELLDLVRRIF